MRPGRRGCRRNAGHECVRPEFATRRPGWRPVSAATVAARRWAPAAVAVVAAGFRRRRWRWRRTRSGGGGGRGGSSFGPVGAVLTPGANLGDGSVSITYDAVTATTVTPTPTLTPVAKSNCDAGKAEVRQHEAGMPLEAVQQFRETGRAARPCAAPEMQRQVRRWDQGLCGGLRRQARGKQDPKKPKTICSVTGDLVTLEDKVDAFVTDLVSEIDPGFPQSDHRANVTPGRRRAYGTRRPASSRLIKQGRNRASRPTRRSSRNAETSSTVGPRALRLAASASSRASKTRRSRKRSAR